MACEYFIGDKKFSEQEFKDFLAKEGLDMFIEEKAIDLSKVPQTKLKAVKPPTKPPSEGDVLMQEPNKKKREFGVKKHLMGAEKIPSNFKKGIEESGLEYAVSNPIEAEKAARGIVDTLGRDNALRLASDGTLDPSVGSAVFTESLNDIWAEERSVRESGDISTANSLAEEFIAVQDELARISNSGGKWNAQLAHSYKNSPMAIVMRVNNDRAEQFKTWLKEKANESDLKEVYEEILSSESATALINEKVEALRKEERKEERKKNYKKIDDFFEKAKMKGGSYATLIPPPVWNAAMDIMNAATKGGYLAVDAVRLAIEHIDKELKGKDWDKDRFRKEYEELLGKLSDSGKKEKTDEDLLNTRIKQLENQIKEYEDRIANGEKPKEKAVDKFKDNEKVIELTKKRDELKEEYSKIKKENAEKDAKVSGKEKLSRLEEAKRKVIESIEDIRKKILEKEAEKHTENKPLNEDLELTRLREQESYLKELRDKYIPKEKDPFEFNKKRERLKDKLINDIIDLNEQINAGEKKKKDKPQSFDDAEINRLRAEKEKRQEILEAIDPTSKEEARIRQAIKSAEKSLEEYNRRIEEEDFSKKETKALAETPELKDIRDRRDAAKKEYNELMKESEFERKKNLGLIKPKNTPSSENSLKITEEEKKIARLEKEKEDLEKGIVKQKNSNELNLTPYQKEKINRLNDDIANLKKNLGLLKSKVEKPLTIDEQIELDNKILENKRKQALERVQKLESEYKRRVEKSDFKSEAYKAKKEIEQELKDAIKLKEEAKKAYDEAKKESPEYKDKKAKQYIEQFRKRLGGLDDKQKEAVIRMSIKKLIENKALNYEDFKKIIADVIGIKELSENDIKKIESLTEDINAVEGFEKEMIKNPTPENIKKYEEARDKSLVSSLELYNIAHKESDIVASGKSMITGSLLSGFSLIKNPIQNLVFQAQMRLPKAVIKQLMDLGLYGAASIERMLGTNILNVKPTSDILAAQKGYFSQLGAGAKKAIFNFKKGTQEQDYFSRYAYRSTLAPREAIKDLKLWKAGEKFLTKEEVWDRRIRASIFARQADLILRGMAVGDIPQRHAAEGATSIQIGIKELGIIDDNVMKAFMASPEKMAYKLLREQGKSETEAAELSKEIKERIVSEGEKAVFQEENILSKFSDNLEKMLKSKKGDSSAAKASKSIGSLFKTITFPFVKIPANVAWASFKAINPQFSIGQALYQGYESRRAEKAGDFAKARKYANESKDSFAHAIVGLGLGVAASSLVANGFVRASNDRDTKAKETVGEKLFGRQSQLNIGRLLGSSDYWVDFSWFGPLGAMLDVKAQMAQDKKQRAVEGKEESLMNDMFDELTYSAKASLNQLVFDQGAKTIDALKGDANAVKMMGINILNNISNVITGATYAQISKNLLTEQARLKGDNLLEEIANNQKQRNILLRTAMNLYKPQSGNPPARISIWGEPMKNDTSISGVVGNLLGFEKSSKDKFGSVIYEDAQRTGNLDFYPPTIQNKISVNGKEIPLSLSEQDELNILIGKARVKLVSPLINGATSNGDYNKLNDTEKVEALKDAYKIAREAGMSEFKIKHPKYQEAELTESEADKKADKKYQSDERQYEFKKILGID